MTLNRAENFSIQSSTYCDMYDSWNNSPDISKMWSAFSLLSILPEILRISVKIQIYLLKPKLSKSEQNSSYLRTYWKHKKARPNVFLKCQDYVYFVIIHSRILINIIRFTNKCRKLFQRLKTVFHSSCYWYVSWDTVPYIPRTILGKYSTSRFKKYRLCLSTLHLPNHYLQTNTKYDRFKSAKFIIIIIFINIFVICYI